MTAPPGPALLAVDLGSAGARGSPALTARYFTDRHATGCAMALRARSSLTSA
ncbi:hypothetical protein EJ065_0645 [Corallococcus coralloides]|uniref:Uncharacterized protein n=1 Tax=Corallococcus coralloides TaxID=184914 RepID=A0A410RK16_CORCK|nr:hypothetical protein EJ065_0645 [Corallococcus coralloides]